MTLMLSPRGSILETKVAGPERFAAIKDWEIPKDFLYQLLWQARTTWHPDTAFVPDIRLEQGSEEWQQVRKQYVAASEVAMVLEESPYYSKWELFQEKALGVELPVTEGQKFARRLGHLLEPDIRNQVNADFGRDFRKISVNVVEHNLPRWASLDGYDEMGPAEIILAALCPSSKEPVAVLSLTFDDLVERIGDLDAIDQQCMAFWCQVQKAEWPADWEQRTAIVIPQVIDDETFLATSRRYLELEHRKNLAFAALGYSEKELEAVKKALTDFAKTKGPGKWAAGDSGLVVSVSKEIPEAVITRKAHHRAILSTNALVEA